MMKATPKSCSCSQCQRGKHSAGGRAMMKHDERAFRHAQKIALNAGKTELSPAPIGHYYD